MKEAKFTYRSTIARNFSLRLMLIPLCSVPLGCSGRVAVVGSQKQETLDTQRKVEYVEKLRDTVIYVTLPRESREREAKADSSFLQTSLATSAAAILPDGSLFHALANKPEPVATMVALPERQTVVEYVERAQQSEIREVPVKLPLSKPEKFLLISGIVFWAVAIFMLVRWLIK